MRPMSWPAPSTPSGSPTSGRVRDHAASTASDGKRRGQVQHWFLFDALSADIEPAPDGSEFVGLAVGRAASG